jgi:hypothetical protein
MPCHHRAPSGHPASGISARPCASLLAACGCCAVQALRGVQSGRCPGPGLGAHACSSVRVLRGNHEVYGSVLHVHSEFKSQRLGSLSAMQRQSSKPDGPTQRTGTIDSGAFRIQVSKNAKNIGSRSIGFFMPPFHRLGTLTSCGSSIIYGVSI